ncbi:putative alpha-amylase [Helianthus annuus]|nr:putative alpha-amylase [Helianthus annuus]
MEYGTYLEGSLHGDPGQLFAMIQISRVVEILQALNWLKNNIGYDGWRLEFVRGFSGEYVKDYIEASNPAFAIGEYWDSLAYEGGDLCYNQDAHRQRVINWINATSGTSSAFDVTTKVIHLFFVEEIGVFI